MVSRLLPWVLVAASTANAPAQSPPPRQPTVAILSEDASLVAAQMGRTVRVWNRASGKRLARLDSPSFFRGSLAPGALVAVTDHGITVWRGPDYAKSVRLRTPRVLSMGRTAISRNGQVATAIFARDGGVGDPNTVGVWDARSGRRLRMITIKGRVLGTALSTDGKLLAIFGDRRGGQARGGALLQIYARDGARVLRWHSKGDRTTFCAAFSSDGKRFALGAGGHLLLWDIAQRKLIGRAEVNSTKALFPRALRGPRVSIPGAHGVAFGPGGKELVTLHGFGVVGIARWSVAPLRPTHWIKRPRAGGPLRQVAFDRQGKLWLVTSSYAQVVYVHTPRGDRFSLQRVLQ